LTHLLSADFPGNFRTAADLLAAQGLTPEDGADPFILHDALVCGIESLAWSPDGRYLAFAGQMDGPSSDVYVAALDGSIVKDLPRSPVPVIAWLGPSTYLVSDGREGIGSFNLRSIDIESGMIETLWKTAFRSPALDREHHLLAIAGYEALSQDTHPALYFVDWNEGSQRKIRFDTSPRPARTCRFTLRTASSSGPSNLPRPARKSIASSGVPTRPVCSSPLEPSCTPPTFWPEKPIR
jgi:hypothetical protein